MNITCLKNSRNTIIDTFFLQPILGFTPYLVHGYPNKLAKNCWISPINGSNLTLYI
jgi:hypothetical protein